jgi:glutathione S-transferase
LRATMLQGRGQEQASASAIAAQTGEILLYRFGPFLGTPDASPFVIKAMLLLKLAGLRYRPLVGNPMTAPRRFLPFIRDEGVTVTDSTLIRWHIERKYGVAFDAALDSRQSALAWAVERMCEDHLYFALLALRWNDDDNFRDGLGRHMFAAVPLPVRPLAKVVLRRMNRKRLAGHGLGRHDAGDLERLAMRDLDALAALLGDQRYLGVDTPCAADATLFGILTAIITPPLRSPIIAAARSHANLVGYCDRIMSRYFAG